MFYRAQNTPLLYSEKTEIIFELFWNVSGDSLSSITSRVKGQKNFQETPQNAEKQKRIISGKSFSFSNFFETFET